MSDSSLRSGQALPTGTVTFLFTDIEGSTKLWEKYPEGMKTSVARHEEIIRTAIETHGGYIFKTVGDAFCAAFATAPDALEATLEFQLVLSAEMWSETDPLKVRASLHTGAAEEREGDYYGPPVNRVARLLSAGHGGQTLISLPTYELVRDELPGDTSLDDLGEHRLKDLARPEHVFQLVSPHLATDFAPLKTIDTRPNNLPAQLTPLIGREKELDAVAKLLLRDDVRLVTLTGPGGTGKTRLGLQVGADLIEEFEDGVFFVSLDPVTDADIVVSTIAHTLGVQEAGGQPIVENLKNYLRDKEILLLLDNFEQITSAAPFISDLLITCPRLKVLVTSRELLHLRGEQDFPVPPLTLPERVSQDTKGTDLVSTLTQYEAVQLFIERAKAVRPDFEVTSENAPAVAEICHRLDGLPLAVELAVGRIRLMKPQEMLERLERRLPLLARGARDLPARQQTLQGTITWSYDLLDESEKVLFRRLSVFVGGCTLESAEAVCNLEVDPLAGSELALNAVKGQALEIDVLEGIASLVDKNLLKQDEVKGDSRFVMLETIREYGQERLTESGEEETTRRNHTNYFLMVAEQAEPELDGPDQVEWLNRLDLEYDNLRAALEWSLGSGEDVGARHDVPLRLARALHWFWFLRGYIKEGYQWLEKALSRNRGLSSSARAKALSAAGFLVGFLGDRGRKEALCQESLALAREVGDKELIADSIFYLGSAALNQSDIRRAIELWEESLALFRELKNKRKIAQLINQLGYGALKQGDYSRAQTLLEECLTLFREQGNKLGILRALGQLGSVALYHRDHDKAAALLEEIQSLGRELGGKSGFTHMSHLLGQLALVQGDYSRARALLEEDLAMGREVGNKFVIAASLRLLGRVASAQGDYGGAVELYKESLTHYQKLGGSLGISECFEGLAEVAVAQEQPERATRLYGAAEGQLETISEPIPPTERYDYDRNVASIRAELGEDGFAAAWAEGRAMSMEEAAEFALN